MWDQRYSQKPFAYGREPNDFLAQAAVALPTGSDVLCLAEGQGRNAVFLATLGHNVVAVDLSRVGLQRAMEWAAENGVPLTTLVADLADFDMGEERWDGIVSIWCHLPPDLRRDVYRRCIRALRPGGILILEAYTPEQVENGTGGPPNPEMMATLDELKQDLDGLEFLYAMETEREVHEGDLHNGWSAVVQIMAKKGGRGPDMIRGVTHPVYP